ncbi:MAG: hypothetical protein M0030_25100 [Actinomycetota bacterium]|nr:hypothetical protein [Actinomycetota bacterium]
MSSVLPQGSRDADEPLRPADPPSGQAPGRPSAGQRADPSRARLALVPGILPRAVVHLAVWAPFAWAVAYLLGRGWRPVSDASAIALRSWDILTAHAPLVGQATRLGQGVFDPGPLEYWLLTVPEHLDPGHGLAWGAALWCMVAGSVAIEASWSVAGLAGGLAAGGVALGTVAWMPGIALQPFWNPWFGVMFLIAAVAVAWAVLSGRRRWWPVLVVTASVAAQAHLLFAVIAVALAMLGLVVGGTDSVRQHTGYRWAWTGLAAGVICWSAPFYQQFTSRSGNLTALLHGQSAGGQRTGLTFGLRAVAGAAGLPPLWRTPLQSLLDLNAIGAGSAVLGAVILAALAALLVLAVRPLRSRRLAALAGIALTACLGSVVTYAGISVRSIPAAPSPLNSLNYLMILLLPVGLLCWLTVAAAITLAAARAARRTTTAPRITTAPRVTTGRGARIVGLLAIAGLAAGASLAASGTAHEFPGVTDARYARVVAISAQQIRQRIPDQPVAITISSPDLGYRKRRLLLGLAYVLTTWGYSPRLSQFGSELGATYVMRPGLRITRVRITLRPGTVLIAISPARSPA